MLFDLITPTQKEVEDSTIAKRLFSLRFSHKRVELPAGMFLFVIHNIMKCRNKFGTQLLPTYKNVLLL